MHTFWTLMLWLVLLKIRLAFIALANRLAWRLSVMDLNGQKYLHTWLDISSCSSRGKLTK